LNLTSGLPSLITPTLLRDLAYLAECEANIKDDGERDYLLALSTRLFDEARKVDSHERIRSGDA
jgi:hypothetical protein